MQQNDITEVLIWILVLGVGAAYLIYALLLPEENKHYPILEGNSLKKIVSGTKDWQPDEKTGELKPVSKTKKRRPVWAFLLKPWEDVAQFNVKLYFVGEDGHLPEGATKEWEFSDSPSVLYSVNQPTNHVRGYSYYFFIIRGVETSGYMDYKKSSDQHNRGPENVTVNFVFGGWVRATNPERAYKKGDYLGYLYQQVQAFLYERLKQYSYGDYFKIQLEHPLTKKQIEKLQGPKTETEAKTIGEDWKASLNKLLKKEIGHMLEDLNLHDFVLDPKSKEFDKKQTELAIAEKNREISLVNKETTRNNLKALEKSYEEFNKSARKTIEAVPGEASTYADAIKIAQPKILTIPGSGSAKVEKSGEMSMDSFMELTKNLIAYKATDIEKEVLGEETDNKSKKKRK